MGESVGRLVNKVFARDSSGAVIDPATLQLQAALNALATTANAALAAIETNTANIKIDADSVNLNTDTLEALIAATNTALSTLNAKDFATQATLAQVKVDTAKLDIALSALRDALKGASNRDFTTLQAAVEAVTTAVQALPSGLTQAQLETELDEKFGDLGQAASSASSPVALSTEQQAILERLPTGVEMLTNAHLFEDVNVDGKPDCWSVPTASGSYVATEHAWQGVMAGAGELLSQTLTLSASTRYVFECRAKRTAGTGNISARLAFYDSGSVLIGVIDGFANASSDYITFSVEGLAPSNAVVAIVSVRVTAASTWRLRRCSMMRLFGPREGQFPDALRNSRLDAADTYTDGQVLPDQPGADAVLTFTFTNPMDLIWVEATGADCRADPFGGTPTAGLGVPCRDGVPKPFVIRATVVKVYAPAGATAVNVFGQRYS